MGTRWVVQAWLGSRLVVLLVGLLIALQQGTGLLAVANHWDAELYGLIAEQGYLPEPNLMAFFPGLPLLMAAGLAVGVPSTLTGMAVSLVGSAAAAAALVRLARSAYDRRATSRRPRPELVAVAWLFAPTAVFTVVPYTESWFCAAAFWAWERARARDWRLAAVLAALACSVRVSGVFLVAALAVLALTQVVDRHGVQWAGLARRAGWLLVPVAAVLAYLGYLYLLTGDPFAWYEAQQSGWMRQFTWPWQSLLNTWDVIRPGAYPDHPLWPPVFRMEVVSMALGVVTTVWCLRRRWWAEATWVGIQVLAFSTSYWFYSVNRATLLWFPLWIMLVELASRQPSRPGPRLLHRAAVVIAATGMALAMVWWCWLFFSGHWAS